MNLNLIVIAGEIQHIHRLPSEDVRKSYMVVVRTDTGDDEMETTDIPVWLFNANEYTQGVLETTVVGQNVWVTGFIEGDTWGTEDDPQSAIKVVARDMQVHDA